MDDVEAYEYLNARFIEFAEEHRRPVAPMLGRRHSVVEMGSPPYIEVCIDRWFSVTPDHGMLDVQWNGLEPAHMQVFADLQSHPFDLFWRLRCAWFNFDVSLEQAEKDVRELARCATVSANH
ncbi:hypothetical protein [Sphingomonas sp.]|uniref:hypothetical protein n=1 Tax=Sphingomonas sp. TaxID=28214 RepID=UPI0025FC5C46|nr:hypothetical protein [Sphingomonas sp.]